jgi:hypothetical protein
MAPSRAQKPTGTTGEKTWTTRPRHVCRAHLASCHSLRAFVPHCPGVLDVAPRPRRGRLCRARSMRAPRGSPRAARALARVLTGIVCAQPAAVPQVVRAALAGQGLAAAGRRTPRGYRRGQEASLGARKRRAARRRHQRHSLRTCGTGCSAE